MAVATAENVESLAEDGVRCPTCRAKQPWSDTCRRCKCDLTLLMNVAEACRQGRRRCLAHLHAGRFSKALQEAKHVWTLRPDRQAARLLAVCLLHNGKFRKAFQTARTAEGETPPE